MARRPRGAAPARGHAKATNYTHGADGAGAAPYAARRADDHRAGRAKGKGGVAVYIPLPCRARAACEEADEHRYGWEQGQGERRAAVMLGYNPNGPCQGPAEQPPRSERRRAEATRRGCKTNTTLRRRAAPNEPNGARSYKRAAAH